MVMASTSPPFTGGRAAPLASSSFSSPSSSTTLPTAKRFSSSFSSSEIQRRPSNPTSLVAVSNAQTRERERLKELFREARNRCLVDPTDGVSFTLHDFLSALDHYEVDSRVGTRVKGTVLMTDVNGAMVDILSKSLAYLPVEEASIYKVKHVAEAGLYPGLEDEFVVVGQHSADGNLILSRRSLQYHLAWERCLQLQSEDAIVIAKVVRRKKGGVVAIVEGLCGFIPLSENAAAEELLGKKLWLKLIEVDEESSKLVLSTCKAEEEHETHMQIGSVVMGTVKSLKSYGAFVDVGGLHGLLHVSQISQKLVVDIATILQPGDKVKVMILHYDRVRGQLSLSTKKLEPTPGDMIRNPKLVFEKAEEMAQIFRQRVAQAGEMACCDMQSFQPRMLGNCDL